jgi:flagellar hook protein FlgE
MGLGSVMQTALSGMLAAEAGISVIANNMANALTPGFKASSPVLVTQSLQTYSVGAGPNGLSGGRNPIQIGRGVRVAGISVNFSQGSLVNKGGSAKLAIQGEGFFILKNSSGQRSFTRDGSFGLNGNNQLVNAAGNHVIGYVADDNFKIQKTQLTPIKIPLGKTVKTQSGGTATLVDYRISGDGRVEGVFSDGQYRDLGQLRLSRFANPSGLDHNGGNSYTIGPNSGVPQESNPQDSGAGQILQGSEELSNTDIARSLVDLQVFSNMYGSNLQVIDTTSYLVDALVNLGRHSN